ncbi:MAG: TolC family protein [Eudoraea sp.]|nr:TolC family protein [Eudoraea sp.]
MKKILLLFYTLLLSLSGSAQNLEIGILTDFEKSVEIDSIFQLVLGEIDRTIGPGTTVELNPENIRYGMGTIENARVAYNDLEPKVDLIIPFGSVSVKGSLEKGTFSKPTIGIGVIDPYLQSLPYEEGRTGLENFSYIWAVKDIRTELLRFRDIHPFDYLSILVNKATSATFSQERGMKYLDSLENLLEANIELVEVSADIEASLASMPAATDAVYISYLDGKTLTDIRAIAEYLKDEKIPSFSSQKWHVDNGIMACISDENDLLQAIRKLAIMVDESVSGEPLSEMPVRINFKEDLFINSATIRALGLGLTFDIYFTANFVEEEADLPTYSLEEVMEKALQHNFGIKITNQDISLALQDVKSARTNVLPTVDLGVSAVQVGSNQANELFDLPERKMTGELVLDQVIFSERAIAGIRIASYLQKAQEFATQAEILDVLLDTYSQYFSLLASKTVLAIEKENLENFKTNLELARIRVDLGSASRAEILRWESEVAAAKQSVVEASTNLRAAMFQLNTSLANTLEEEYDIEDIGVDDAFYEKFRDNAFSPFVNSPNELQAVVAFLVEESTRNNPNKQFVLEQIKAVERQKVQNKRVFYLPNIALKAQTQQVLLRGGKASENSFGIPDNTWNVGVGLAFPIFDANRRRVDYQTSKIQLEQLENSRQQLDQQLELAVRTSVLNLVATSTNIEFSQTSADNAVANFELVRDKYQAGDISITQLIDAQQTALGAKQRYAVAVYDYIQSQLQLEFAVGFFSMFATPAQLQEFNDRYFEFLNNQ